MAQVRHGGSSVARWLKCGAVAQVRCGGSSEARWHSGSSEARWLK